MLRTGLFVALVLMASRTTASDLSREATELDEDTAPEEPTTSSPTTPAPTAPAGSPITPPAPLTSDITSNPALAAIFSGTVKAVSADSIGAAFTEGAVIELKNIAGVPQISYSVTAAPNVTGAAGGGGTLAVVMRIGIDLAAFQANKAGMKLALGLSLAQTMNILYSQINALKVIHTTGGVSYTLGRHGKALSNTDVQVTFSVCEALGCLGTGWESNPIAPYGPNTISLPAVRAALARPVRLIAMSDVTTAFPAFYELKSEIYNLPSVDAVIQEAPTQKVDSTTSNIKFFLSTNVEWTRISPNPGLYKSAWQLAIADRLIVNPYQVTEIAFVRMAESTTVSRRAESESVFERVNAHQTVCQSLCAPNEHGVTPVPSTDDDESAIIAIAVVVPVVVVGTLITLYCVFCASEPEPGKTHEPYGHGKEEEMEEPTQEKPEDEMV